MPVEGETLCWCARCVLLRRWLEDLAIARRLNPCPHHGSDGYEVPGELTFCPLCTDMDINIGPCLEKR